MDLIRAGLQDLDKARALFDQLKADDIPDERCAELLSALAHACDPDMALSNFVDIVNAMQSSQRDLEHVIPDNDALKRLVTVLGVSDAMGKFMRFKPQLVEAAAVDNCNSHLFNHAQRRARLLKAVGADPDEPAMPVASKDLAEAATALRSSYRNQLAAIIAQDAVADDPTSIQPTISRELSDLADAALEGALAIARHETEGSEHVRFTIIGMGKLGAQELNYVSDVDLIYVVEPADKDVDHQTLIRVGTKMGTIYSASASPPSWAWPSSRCGRSTAACARKARTARWCACSPRTRTITSSGPRIGSSKRCSRPARWPATPTSVRPTWT